ncbi:hypothetical protein [Endobacterium cereale]|uniref:hypothetical protein n=1 Tax=Endobacterium cereale TaxID=2663029 RepID=UPI002B4A9E29|nr:hypothetical protein [Endobacterium cereale]MEB2845886.1 hypothetical protein [Endobacterium cereale]
MISVLKRDGLRVVPGYNVPFSILCGKLAHFERLVSEPIGCPSSEVALMAGDGFVADRIRTSLALAAEVFDRCAARMKSVMIARIHRKKITLAVTAFVSLVLDERVAVGFVAASHGLLW